MGYRRVVFTVKYGELYVGFLQSITKDGEPIYDWRVIPQNTTEQIYKSLKEFYKDNGSLE